MSTLLERGLSESPTLKELRLKTDQVNTVIELMRKIFEAKLGGLDDPIVSTTLEPGSVVFKVVAANPSKTKTQKVPVKIYLPAEVEARDILDQGGLELEYDSEKAAYYLYKNDLKLVPLETAVFNIEIEDVWIISEDITNRLKKRTVRVVEELEETDYYIKAKEVADTIYKRLDEILSSQSDESISRNKHIGIYRVNLKIIEKIKEDIERLEKLLTFAGGPPVPEMLEKSKLRLDAPSTTTTWMIIFIIIIFIGALGTVFFFTWQRQQRSTKSFFTQAKKSSFSKDEESAPEEEKEKGK